MRKTVVFTDMDGTLLDHDTFSIRMSVPSVDMLIRRGCLIVPVSSKTAAEIRGWMKILSLDGPFICENGCGIVIPRGYFPNIPIGAVESSGEWIIPLGARIEEVRKKLRDAASEAGVAYKGFGEMSEEEISRCSGLGGGEIKACLEREYDEPFLLERGEEYEKMDSFALKRGIVLTRGGRFDHAAGGCDKGRAVRVLVDIYRELHPDVLTIAVGDSQNDLAMFRAVDRGYLVRKPDGSYDPGISEKDAARVPWIGPKGFKAVTEEIIRFG